MKDKLFQRLNRNAKGFAVTTAPLFQIIKKLERLCGVMQPLEADMKELIIATSIAVTLAPVAVTERPAAPLPADPSWFTPPVEHTLLGPRDEQATVVGAPAPTAAPLTAASVGSGLRAMRRNPS